MKHRLKNKASGGTVKGMNPYMVGERGPELFIPATGGNIIPNNRMANGSAAFVSYVLLNSAPPWQRGIPHFP